MWCQDPSLRCQSLTDLLFVAIVRRRSCSTRSISMAAHPDPELWATLPDAERLLSNILADPRGNHVVAVEKQSIGILCDAHVAGIVRALQGLSAGAVFPKSFTRDAGAALHTVLYHLLGGADLNLPAPTRESTRQETQRCSPGWSVARPAKLAFFNVPARGGQWEPESAIHDDFIDAYETGMAEMEAEEDLKAEEEADDDEDEDGKNGSVPRDTA